MIRTEQNGCQPPAGRPRSRTTKTRPRVWTRLECGGVRATYFLFLIGQLLIPVGGCAAYQLRGTVIEGPASTIKVVKPDDARLAEPGLGRTLIAVTVDPRGLDRQHLRPEVADGAGRFAVEIEHFAAGFLNYDVRVVARLRGHNSAVHTLRLPGRDKRLLIILAHGPDTYRPQDDNLLEETLEMGERYLRGR